MASPNSPTASRSWPTSAPASWPSHVRGPELNVPQSIVEYRPEPQIRAYIRDPRTFRYGNMPPHPHLSDADLDALLAYFRAMKDRKHDPDAHALPH